MCQSVWIGIEAEALEMNQSAAVQREELDRGGVIPLEQWNTGIEAVATDGTVVGYGIIVNEDFPEEFEINELSAYQQFIPAIKRVLEQFGFKGPVGVVVQDTDGSLVPALNIGEPNIPSTPDYTVH